MKVYEAYAVYNLDWDKDYTPLVVSPDKDKALSAIVSRAEEDDNEVKTLDIIKRGAYLCSDETTMYGISEVDYVV